MGKVLPNYITIDYYITKKNDSWFEYVYNTVYYYLGYE